MEDPFLHIKILKPSRKKLRPGDVFVMHMPAAGYVFGRVIFVDLPTGPMGPGSNLVYIYDHVGSDPKDFDDRDLKPSRLLFGPKFINRLPWSRGYFENVGFRPLVNSDVLPRHRFFDVLTSKIFDLDGNDTKETECVGPCGFWGLDSYATVDIDVAKALAIDEMTDSDGIN